jgi:nitroimidazol reductase NimA-like FMN-containing flavoprotein (pyridoxamine 5'-phosphate oxidase superfamily)
VKKYHVRLKEKEITDETLLKQILQTTQYVTLAMSKDNLPYLVSLSHGYDKAQHCLYFHCAQEGKKLDYLTSNNIVWGQALLDHKVSADYCSHLYASVHFLGKVTLLDTLDEKRHAMECMIRQLKTNPEEQLAKLRRASLEATVFGRIDIEYMSGKKSKEVTLS